MARSTLLLLCLLAVLTWEQHATAAPLLGSGNYTADVVKEGVMEEGVRTEISSRFSEA